MKRPRGTRPRAEAGSPVARPAKTENDADLEPALMETQRLDGPVVAESANADSAFEEDAVLDVIDADDLDQSFIDELENSMSEEIRQDQLGR